MLANHTDRNGRMKRTSRAKDPPFPFELKAHCAHDLQAEGHVELTAGDLVSLLGRKSINTSKTSGAGIARLLMWPLLNTLVFLTHTGISEMNS